jgi:oxygen-dependent protoporphyrinogen oxidase
VAAGASLLAAVGSVVGAGGSDGDGPPFLGLTGGVGRLPRLLESAVVAAGGRVQRETTVVALTRSGPRWVITTRTPDGRPGPDRIGPVDAVVVATPAEVAGRLLAPLAPAAGSVLCAVRSADVGVVALAVDADSVPRLVHGTESGVLVPHAEARAAGLAVKALTFASAKWPWIVDQDPATAVLRASVGRADEPGALRLPDDALVARVVADTARIVGGPVRVRAAVVRRWPRSLPQYAVGHAEAMLQVRAAVSEVPGLGLAGAVLEGVGLPACVATGRAAAASALAHLSGTARPAVVPSAPAAPTVQEDS